MEEAFETFFQEFEKARQKDHPKTPNEHRKKWVRLQRACETIVKDPETSARIIVGLSEEKIMAVAYGMRKYIRTGNGDGLVSSVILATDPHGTKDHLLFIREITRNYLEKFTVSDTVEESLSRIEDPSCDEATIQEVAEFLGNRENWE
jgi:altronate dehydratase